LSDGTLAVPGWTDEPQAASTASTESVVEAVMSTRISDLLRPDGRLLVRPEASWTPDAAAAAAELATRRSVSALTHIDAEATVQHVALTRAGFVESRREAVVAISVEPALAAIGDTALPAGIRLRSAAEVDEDRLRHLDDELRQDVAGTSGWRSTHEEFRDHTFADPDFDPTTYLVAIDSESGDYVGLVRIWMGLSGSRLGMVGVRREQRRRGIASALIAEALRAVRSAGVAEVTTTYDLTNDASKAIAERLGGRLLRANVELVYEPEPQRAGSARHRKEPSRVG
jgi:predicted acetyltransferase